MDMMEQRSFGIDSHRARELQQVAQGIETKFSDGVEIDFAGEDEDIKETQAFLS